MAVWLYGCMAVWLYGCMAVWLYGCMAVWLYGCVAVLWRCLPFFLFGYFMLHIAAVWRRRYLKSKLWEKTADAQQQDVLSWNAKRCLCLQEFLQLLCDVLFVPLWVILLVTFYRLDVAIDIVKDKEKDRNVSANCRRGVVCWQCLQLLCDMPFVVAFFVCFVNVLRVPLVCRDLHQVTCINLLFLLCSCLVGATDTGDCMTIVRMRMRDVVVLRFFCPARFSLLKDTDTVFFFLMTING
jgi:hypothetical protein